MSQIEDNPSNPDLFAHLQTPGSELQTSAHGSNKRGAAVVEKTTHPVSPVPDFVGLPTNDSRSQVLLELRNQELMTTPIIVDGTDGSPDFGKTRYATPADLDTFNLEFLVSNGMRVNSIAFVNNKTLGNTMQQDYANTDIQQNYDVTRLPEDAQLYRTVYKSLTAYLNATAFNSTGMVTGEQFNPNIMFAGTLLAFLDEQPQKAYQYIKSILKRHKRILAANHDQFATWMDFPAHHRHEIMRHCNLQPHEGLDLDPNTSLQVIYVGHNSSDTPKLAPSSSQILQQSQRSYGGLAKDGAFSVQRLNTVSPAWMSAGNTSRAAAATGNGLYQCVLYVTYSGGGIFQPLYENAPVGTPVLSLKPLTDTLWSKDMTWAWIRFDGLSINPTTASTSMQLLIKKFYTGFEIQPALGSPWSGMVKVGPKPDLEVMQAMMDAFYELKDVLPAMFNFWGTLGQIALKGAKTFGSSILANILKDEKSKKGRTIKQSGYSKSTSDGLHRRSLPNRPANKGRPPWADVESKLADIESRMSEVAVATTSAVAKSQGKHNKRKFRGGVHTSNSGKPKIKVKVTSANNPFRK